MIEKDVKYLVKGYTFDDLEEARLFEEDHEFSWCDFEDSWIALSKKDLVKYRELFKTDRCEIFKMVRSLSNSNSMGSLYPLSCISYVLKEFGLSCMDAWED